MSSLLNSIYAVWSTINKPSEDLMALQFPSYNWVCVFVAQCRHLYNRKNFAHNLDKDARENCVNYPHKFREADEPVNVDGVRSNPNTESVYVDMCSQGNIQVITALCTPPIVNLMLIVCMHIICLSIFYRLSYSCLNRYVCLNNLVKNTDFFQKTRSHNTGKYCCFWCKTEYYIVS